MFDFVRRISDGARGLTGQSTPACGTRQGVHRGTILIVRSAGAYGVDRRRRALEDSYAGASMPRLPQLLRQPPALGRRSRGPLAGLGRLAHHRAALCLPPGLGRLDRPRAAPPPVAARQSVTLPAPARHRMSGGPRLERARPLPVAASPLVAVAGCGSGVGDQQLGAEGFGPGAGARPLGIRSDGGAVTRGGGYVSNPLGAAVQGSREAEGRAGAEGRIHRQATRN